MIFETVRLLVRELSPDDIHSYYELHSNEKVMRCTDQNCMNKKESKYDLKKIIGFYIKPENTKYKCIDRYYTILREYACEL